MRKILFAVALLGSLCAFEAEAQKKKSTNNVVLRTDIDTLSYAYAVDVANQGITAYLQQLNVLVDSTSITNNYNAKIDAAESNQEKERLNKEMKQKLATIEADNKKNISSFLEGVSFAINSEKDDAYKAGTQIGSQVNNMASEFVKEYTNNENNKPNKNNLIAGLTSVLLNEPVLLKNYNAIVEEKSNKIRERKQMEEDRKNKKVIDNSKAFLAENSKKPGIVTLPSGLQYKIITEGKGSKPTTSDKVKVHYEGRLTDGTKFDSSIDRGEPVSFGVTQVIKGWTEALQLMPVGSKWTIYVPQELGYGPNGTGPIPPYANLVFDIELLDIE